MTSIYNLTNFINNNEIILLDSDIIPSILYNAVIKRNDTNVLKILVNNPDLCNYLMGFYQKLKMSYSLYSQNKCGSVIKLNWTTHNYNNKYITFVQSFSLQQYIIKEQRVSNLFYLNVQLGKFLQTIKLFKSYKNNNKYFCNYEWLKHIDYQKFKNLIPYQIDFNLYNSIACNDSFSLNAQLFLKYYIFLFKL
jgi:hypothetical protein